MRQPPEQFTALHQKYSSLLLRFFSRRFRDPTLAEDMVQQVFERLIRRGDVDGIENPGGYLFQTARSVLVDHLRHCSRHEPVAYEAFEEVRHAPTELSPELIVAGRQRLGQVDQVLQSLPERTRLIFMLRRIEGQRYAEIGTRFGISVSAVEKHMERAIAALPQGEED